MLGTRNVWDVLLINLILVTVLGITLHYWMDYVNTVYPVPGRHLDAIDDFTRSLRNILNLAIFAAGSTALALARRYVTAAQKLQESEAARAQSEYLNLRSQINPHFLLNTLNNIYALTAIDQERAQDAIQQLSKMLRHMLYDNQESEVMLWACSSSPCSSKPRYFFTRKSMTKSSTNPAMIM